MQATKSHVSKGDTVMVIAGKEKSKTGQVLQLLPKKDSVVVAGLNMVKRHLMMERLSSQVMEKAYPTGVK